MKLKKFFLFIFASINFHFSYASDCETYLKNPWLAPMDYKLILSQLTPGLSTDNKACAPLCVINAFQMALTSQGQSPIPNSFSEVSSINSLRIKDIELGATFGEILEMLNYVNKKYYQNKASVQIHLLDAREDELDADITKINEIKTSLLASNLNKTKFLGVDLISFALENNLRAEHGVLILGKDKKTQHYILLDPSIGKTALISFKKIELKGKKTLAIQFEGSSESNPYWESYSSYGQLVVTSVIAIKF